MCECEINTFCYIHYQRNIKYVLSFCVRSIKLCVHLKKKEEKGTKEERVSKLVFTKVSFYGTKILNWICVCVCVVCLKEKLLN